MTIVNGSQLRGWPAATQLATHILLLTSTLALAAGPGILGMSLTIKAGCSIESTASCLTILKG